jgi:hypothetical protein
MWQIFTNSEGLAIQSTIEVAKALNPENNYKQFIGEVNYIDYKRTFRLMTCFPFSFQTKTFQYEREFG